MDTITILLAAIIILIIGAIYWYWRTYYSEPAPDYRDDESVDSGMERESYTTYGYANIPGHKTKSTRADAFDLTMRTKMFAS